MQAEKADVTILTPELNTNSDNGISRLARVRALPLRPRGQFYLVHKISRGLVDSPADDCGRLYPLQPTPPSASASLNLAAATPSASSHASQSAASPVAGAAQGNSNNNHANIVAEFLARGMNSTTAAASAAAYTGPSDLCAVLLRPDMIFADIDLGEHDLDDDHFARRLLGVTLPSGGWTDKHRFYGDFLARFRGDYDRAEIPSFKALDENRDIRSKNGGADGVFGSGNSLNGDTDNGIGSSSGTSGSYDSSSSNEYHSSNGRRAKRRHSRFNNSSSMYGNVEAAPTTPRYLSWFRGKCHGGTRSKCKFTPSRCTEEQNNNAKV